ncbi:hypothetical protein IscW_ISCW015815, partial [Ixodes scapularis]
GRGSQSFPRTHATPSSPSLFLSPHFQIHESRAQDGLRLPPIPPVGCLKNPSEEPSTRAPPRGFFSDVAFSSRQGRGDGRGPRWFLL